MATMAAVPLATASHPQKHRRGKEEENRGGGELVEKHLGRNLVPSAMKVFESQHLGETIRGLNVHTQLCCTEDFLNLFQVFHIFMRKRKML